MIKPNKILAFLTICGICLTQASAGASSSSSAAATSSSAVTALPENMSDIAFIVRTLIESPTLRTDQKNCCPVLSTNGGVAVEDLAKAYPNVKLYICSNIVPPNIGNQTLNLGKFVDWLNYSKATFESPKAARIIIEIRNNEKNTFQTATFLGNGYSVPISTYTPAVATTYTTVD